MSRTRFRYAALLSPLLAAACVSDLDLGDQDGSGGADGSSDTVAEPATGTSTGAAETTLGDDGTTLGGTTDSSMGDPTGDGQDVASPDRCAAQLDEASCNAVPTLVVAEADATHQAYCDEGNDTCDCAWLPLWPVTVEGDTCSYGEQVGRCLFQDFPESGCPNELCAGGETYAVYTSDEDGVLVGHGWGCGEAGEGESYCGATDAPDECACACDESWPGPPWPG